MAKRKKRVPVPAELWEALGLELREINQRLFDLHEILTQHCDRQGMRPYRRYMRALDRLRISMESKVLRERPNWDGLIDQQRLFHGGFHVVQRP